MAGPTMSMVCLWYVYDMSNIDKINVLNMSLMWVCTWTYIGHMYDHGHIVDILWT